jgi:hypothetical protein
MGSNLDDRAAFPSNLVITAEVVLPNLATLRNPPILPHSAGDLREAAPNSHLTSNATWYSGVETSRARTV